MDSIVGTGLPRRAPGGPPRRPPGGPTGGPPPLYSVVPLSFLSAYLNASHFLHAYNTDSNFKRTHEYMARYLLGFEYLSVARVQIFVRLVLLS